MRGERLPLDRPIRVGILGAARTTRGRAITSWGPRSSEPTSCRPGPATSANVSAMTRQGRTTAQSRRSLASRERIFAQLLDLRRIFRGSLVARYGRSGRASLPLRIRGRPRART